MKKAFTLIELMVVIGIIAVLAGVLLATFGGATESARAAHCLSNMKTLANACMSAAEGCPPAESSEVVRPYIEGGMAKAKKQYTEKVGWISWYSENLYPAFSTQKKSCNTVGLYSDNVDEYQYALKHGALFEAINGNTELYVCPSHRKLKPNVHWSYFMNPNVEKSNQYIAGSARFGSKIKIYVDNKMRDAGADRVLLLGEIPFAKGSPGSWFPSGSEGSEETDAVLQYDKENIGGNHKSGKAWMAHVVFADGHVEKLKVSDSRGKPLKDDDLRQLTEWLCTGVDISFNGSRYEKLAD